MSALLSELENKGFVLPDFANCNVEVMKQIAEGSGKYAGDKHRKIFLLIDGFGYNLYKKVVAKYPEIKSMFGHADVHKITSIYPSFTLTVLPSIDSGLSVAETGLPGENIPIREIGTIFSTLSYTTAFGKDVKVDLDTSVIFPKPRLINKMRKKGRVAYVQSEWLIKKTYSTHAFGDTDHVPYVYSSFEDMLLKVAYIVKKRSHEYVYAYCGLIDHAQHKYSPDSKDILELLYCCLISIKRILLPLLKGSDYDLIITADHGQGTYQENKMTEIAYDSEFARHLTMPPWGMSRARILSVAPGMEKSFENLFAKRYGKKGMLVNSDEAIASGLFGAKTVSRDLRYRFGTHIIIVNDGEFFHYEYPNLKKWQTGTFGHHGGLSKAEMEIPVLIF